MSRIGKKPVQIPDKVKARVEEGRIFVEGPKGKMDWAFPKNIALKVEGSKIFVERLNDDVRASSMHGLSRTYVTNMTKGVNEGFVKELELQGVGYRAQTQGKSLNLQLGFSHAILYPIPEGITIKTPKPNQIIVEGIDKAKVGEVAAEIRDYLKPEPYKGKGIRYKGEYVRKKAGKAVA